jgi:hypothetical protein
MRRRDAAQLFLSLEAGMQVPLVTVSHSSPRTIAPPPCLLLDIKDSEGGCEAFLDGRFLAVGGFLLKGEN